MEANEALQQEVISLERKLTLLLTAYGQMKEENALLKRQNGEMEDKLKDQDAKVEDFQNQLKFIKIADVSTADKAEVEEVKQQLTEYIKQIDRAIAHLSE